jgi:hypothetical protein
MKVSNNAKLVQKWKRRFYRQQINLQKAEDLVAKLLCSIRIKNSHQGKSNYGDFKNNYLINLVYTTENKLSVTHFRTLTHTSAVRINEALQFAHSEAFIENAPQAQEYGSKSVIFLILYQRYNICMKNLYTWE